MIATPSLTHLAADSVLNLLSIQKNFRQPPTPCDFLRIPTWKILAQMKRTDREGFPFGIYSGSIGRILLSGEFISVAHLYHIYVSISVQYSLVQSNKHDGYYSYHSHQAMRPQIITTKYYLCMYILYLQKFSAGTS